MKGYFNEKWKIGATSYELAKKSNKIMPRRSGSLSCQSDKKFSEHLKPVDEKKLIRTQAIDTPKDKTHNS